MELNPAHIVAVRDFSRETLRMIIAQLEVSTDFEHLVYRESELDAIWSLAGFHVRDEKALHIREIAHRAHDLVAAHARRMPLCFCADSCKVAV